MRDEQVAQAKLNRAKGLRWEIEFGLQYASLILWMNVVFVSVVQFGCQLRAVTKTKNDLK